MIQFPWGGTGAAAQFEAIYTNREDRKQFVVPAAVFFIFDEAGKIESVRLYMLRDEAAEIAWLRRGNRVPRRGRESGQRQLVAKIRIRPADC